MKLLAVLSISIALAQVRVPGPGGATAVSGSYTGPGDITSGATAWWGLRAYSSATRGNKSINLCNPSDVACGDVLTDPSSGSLPTSISIGGHDCTAGDCTVKMLYDQTSGNLCTTSCDLTQTTIANRPFLTHNCIGSLWCMTWPSTGYLHATTILSAISEPYTSSVITERTANFTTSMEVIGSENGGTPNVGRTAFASAANTIFIYSGGIASVGSIADSSFHALQTVFNGNSSVLYVDGTNNTGLAGGGGSLSSSFCFGCNGTTTSVLSVEGGFWPGDQSANFTAMNSNQHTYWGF